MNASIMTLNGGASGIKVAVFESGGPLLGWPVSRALQTVAGSEPKFEERNLMMSHGYEWLRGVGLDLDGDRRLAGGPAGDAGQQGGCEMINATNPESTPVYTCPMHPDVHQDHPGNCPDCGMALEPGVTA